MRRLKRRASNYGFKFLKVKQVARVLACNKIPLLFWFLFLAGIGALIININSFIFASEFFNVTEIEVIDKYSNKIDYPLARIRNNSNIMKIDLQKIANNLEREYPDIQKAIVMRVLPNKLIVDILRRKPIAQASATCSASSQTYFFAINENGYILSNLGTKPIGTLPVISGVNLNLERVQIGHQYRKGNLLLAVSLLKKLNESGFLDRYFVSKVETDNPRSLSFYINENLEIKIGNRNWHRKIENLYGVLQNMDLTEAEDTYIDLRFKDFVIGKK